MRRLCLLPFLVAVSGCFETDQKFVPDDFEGTAGFHTKDLVLVAGAWSLDLRRKDTERIAYESDDHSDVLFVVGKKSAMVQAEKRDGSGFEYAFLKKSLHENQFLLVTFDDQMMRRLWPHRAEGPYPSVDPGPAMFATWSFCGDYLRKGRFSIKCLDRVHQITSTSALYGTPFADMTRLDIFPAKESNVADDLLAERKRRAFERALVGSAAVAVQPVLERECKRHFDRVFGGSANLANSLPAVNPGVSVPIPAMEYVNADGRCYVSIFGQGEMGFRIRDVDVSRCSPEERECRFSYVIGCYVTGRMDRRSCDIDRVDPAPRHVRADIVDGLVSGSVR